MSVSLAKLFAAKMIARPDVKAQQFSNGSYAPTRNGDQNVGWSKSDIEAHIAGTKTFGHYLLNTDDQVKLFCLDVDLLGLDRNKEAQGSLPIEGLEPGEVVSNFTKADPRAVWADRKDPRRNYLKYCMRLGAHMLAERVQTELDIPVAVAYSGNKGYHVYGLTGLVPALDAREAGMIVLDSLNMFTAKTGDSNFELRTLDDENPYRNFSIELYPKQSSLAGKDLGNLLRLPLGRNQKSKDPTFFVDMTAPLTEMRPVDPVWALTTDNPWKREGE